MKYRHDSCHFRTTYGSRTLLSSSGTPVLHIRAKTFQRTEKGSHRKFHFDTTPFYIAIGYAYACSNIF